MNQLLDIVGEGYPSAYAKNNAYSVGANKAGWTQGFWSGILWHTYDITADAAYKDAALGHVDSFYTRIVEQLGTDNHDMGFLYTLSCMSAYKETGDTKAKEALLLAADQLMARYHEDVGFIQAWGTMGDEDEYRLIIDTFMNLPLLYYATELTGDDKYADAAYTHYKTAVSVLYREDGGSYHTYYFDKTTGEPAYGKTKQGYADESTWSRGQSWGMYGALLTYIYTGDESCLDVFKMAANYFINHLPEDDVAYWDFTFTTGSTEARDSSATAIAVCALLESLKHLDKSDPYYAVYEGAANRIMEALIDTCSTASSANVGLMLHGTGSGTSGIDTMTIFGDYFYIEALHRFIDPEWELYW